MLPFSLRNMAQTGIICGLGAAVLFTAAPRNPDPGRLVLLGIRCGFGAAVLLVIAIAIGLDGLMP